MLAQAGIPLTGGFVAKLEIFSAAIDASEYGLAVIGVLASVVAAFFYLRIVVALFTAADDDAEEPAGRGLRVDGWSGAVLTITASAVLYAGILPNAWLDFAKDATFL